MNERSEPVQQVERCDSGEAASHICVHFHSVHEEGSLLLPGQRQSREEEEKRASSVPKGWDVSSPALLGGSKWGLRYVPPSPNDEIKLFSIAMGLRKNKWVNQ